MQRSARVLRDVMGRRLGFEVYERIKLMFEM
jgi:hypothetical protein